jgi:hypothetical protein
MLLVVVAPMVVVDGADKLYLTLPVDYRRKEET